MFGPVSRFLYPHMIVEVSIFQYSKIVFYMHDFQVSDSPLDVDILYSWDKGKNNNSGRNSEFIDNFYKGIVDYHGRKTGVVGVKNGYPKSYLDQLKRKWRAVFTAAAKWEGSGWRVIKKKSERNHDTI